MRKKLAIAISCLLLIGLVFGLSFKSTNKNNAVYADSLPTYNYQLSYEIDSDDLYSIITSYRNDTISSSGTTTTNYYVYYINDTFQIDTTTYNSLVLYSRYVSYTTTSGSTTYTNLLCLFLSTSAYTVGNIANITKSLKLVELYESNSYIQGVEFPYNATTMTTFSTANTLTNYTDRTIPIFNQVNSSYSVIYNQGYTNGYTNGSDDVKNNPNDYSLYTQSQYNSSYQSGYNEGYSVGVDSVSEQGVATITSFRQLLHGTFETDYATYWNVYSGTATLSNNELTITNAIGRNGIMLQSSYMQTLTDEHVYIGIITIKNDVRMQCTISTNSYILIDSSDEYITYGKVFTANSSTLRFDIFPYTSGETGSFSIKNLMLFDLTEIFGSGNEPSTLNEFQVYFPSDYYDYTITTTDVNIGYVKGYNQGKADYALANADTDFFSNVFNALSEILQIEVFPNITILTIISIPIILGIFLVVLKFIRG